MKQVLPDKKAQAAMEFLMTYGWAILVVLVVIGALAYFGVLSPATLLPEKCTFPVSLSCTDHSIALGSQTLVLQNGAGRDMIIRDITISGEALGGTTAFSQSCLPMCMWDENFWGFGDPRNDITLRNGASQSFLLNMYLVTGSGAVCGPRADACNFKDTGRDKNRYNVTVFYSWLDSPSIVHQLPGELLARKP